MIGEDQLDRSARRISGIERYEEFDELAVALAVAVSDRRVNLPVSSLIPAARPMKTTELGATLNSSKPSYDPKHERHADLNERILETSTPTMLV